MDFLGILVWVKRLLNVPDLSNKPAIREWISQLLDFSDNIAQVVPGTFDDKSIVLLKAMTANDQTWDAFYDVLQEVFASGELPMSNQKAVVLHPMVPSGIDWGFVFQILKLLIELLRKE